MQIERSSLSCKFVEELASEFDVINLRKFVLYAVLVQVSGVECVSVM